MVDLKKEIKLSDLFRRKPKAPKAKAPKAATEKPTPFWKKEISLKRKPKPPEPVELAPVADEDWVREQLALAAAAAAAEPAPGIHPPVPASELPPLPKEKEQSLLKKDISFRRKPKAKKEPKQKKEPKAAQPFWKRDISLKRPEPKGSKAKGSAGGEAPKRLRGPKIGASRPSPPRLPHNRQAGLLQLAREPPAPRDVVAGGRPA